MEPTPTFATELDQETAVTASAVLYDIVHAYQNALEKIKAEAEDELDYENYSHEAAGAAAMQIGDYLCKGSITYFQADALLEHTLGFERIDLTDTITYREQSSHLNALLDEYSNGTDIEVVAEIDGAEITRKETIAKTPILLPVFDSSGRRYGAGILLQFESFPDDPELRRILFSNASQSLYIDGIVKPQ